MPETIALLRTPDSSITDCQLTHMERGAIDFSEIKRQHLAYTECLKKLGIKIEFIPELLGSPDGVFVEDTALVLDEMAVICRPGADSDYALQIDRSYRQAQRIINKIKKNDVPDLSVWKRRS